MLGSVVTLRQFHWPPMLHERPRFSMYRSLTEVAAAPVAAVKESPIAAITLMSPERKQGRQEKSEKVDFKIEVLFLAFRQHRVEIVKRCSAERLMVCPWLLSQNLNISMY